MSPLLLLALSLTTAARAETTPLLSVEDIVRVMAARSSERLHCARLVQDAVMAERARCLAGAGAGCAEIRADDYSAMAQVLMSGGGIQQGNEAYTLGLMAASGCPGVFTLPGPATGGAIVERTRWRVGAEEEVREYFTAVAPGREIRVEPPASNGGGDDLLNRLQAQAEDLLGYDFTPNLRCGVEAKEVPGYHVRNGRIVIGQQEVAFAGCTWSSRGRVR